MAPAVTRELSINYGGTVVGGTSDDFLLDGEVVVTEDSQTATVSFSCICRGTSEGDFEDNIRTFESAFRDPRKRLRVILGSETLYDFDPSSGVNTGFNQQPSFNKVGDPDFDSGRSCRYNVNIVVDLPADVYDQSGRRDSTVTLTFSPSRVRTLTITGEYRALTTQDSARTQYENNISAYVTTLTLGFGGTWELAEEESSSDDTDKICSFRRVYDEIIFDQAQGVDDDEDIVRQELRAKVVRDHPGDSPGENAHRFAELEVSYSAWIDKDNTTNLRQKWTGTIRSHVIAESLAAFGASSGAVMHEEYELDRPQNRIVASMRLFAIVSGKVIEHRKTVKIHEIIGEQLIPAWTGNRFSKYRYLAEARRIRTTTKTTRVAKRARFGGGGRSITAGAISGPGVSISFPGGGGGSSFTAGPISGPGVSITMPQEGQARDLFGNVLPGEGGGGGGGQQQQGQWVLMETDNEETPLQLGDPDRAGAISVTDLTTMTIEEWYVPISFSNTTGGGGGPTMSRDSRGPVS